MNRSRKRFDYIHSFWWCFFEIKKLSSCKNNIDSFSRYILGFKITHLRNFTLQKSKTNFFGADFQANKKKGTSISGEISWHQEVNIHPNARSLHLLSKKNNLRSRSWTTEKYQQNTWPLWERIRAIKKLKYSLETTKMKVLEVPKSSNFQLQTKNFPHFSSPHVFSFVCSTFLAIPRNIKLKVLLFNGVWKCLRRARNWLLPGRSWEVSNSSPPQPLWMHCSKTDQKNAISKTDI